MNRFEFYDNIRKYKENTLAHSDINKYYRKVDLGNGNWRYFYSKEEYDAYVDNKNKQGASQDNAKGVGNDYQKWLNQQKQIEKNKQGAEQAQADRAKREYDANHKPTTQKSSLDNARGAGSDYQRYLDEQKVKAAEVARQKEIEDAERSKKNDRGRYQAIQTSTGGSAKTDEEYEREEISRKNDQGRANAIATSAASIKNYISDGVKDKAKSVLNSAFDSGEIKIKDIKNILEDVQDDLIKNENINKDKVKDEVIKEVQNVLNNVKGKTNEVLKLDEIRRNYRNIVNDARMVTKTAGGAIFNYNTPPKEVNSIAAKIIPWLVSLFT